MANLILNQDINYELACTNIKNPSKKGCTVAPWQENRRCCFICDKCDESESGKIKECIFVEDTKDALKERKNYFEKRINGKVKIKCDSKYMLKFILTFILLCFIFF